MIDFAKLAAPFPGCRKSLLDRIAFEPNSGCWLWTGRAGVQGYGIVLVALAPNRHSVAHKAVYEVLRGPVPPGLQLDHKCRVRSCVNPDHLEPVTPKENVARSTVSAAASRRGAQRTHCPNGHRLTADNVYFDRNDRGYELRRCRRCVTERVRARYRLSKMTEQQI